MQTPEHLVLALSSQPRGSRCPLDTVHVLPVTPSCGPQISHHPPQPPVRSLPWEGPGATMLLARPGTPSGVSLMPSAFSPSVLYTATRFLSLSPARWVTSVSGDGGTGSWCDCLPPLLAQGLRSAGAVQLWAARQSVGGHPSRPPAVTLPGLSWTGLGQAASRRAAMRLRPVGAWGWRGPPGSRVAAGARTPARGLSVAWASSQHGGGVAAVAL